MKRSVAGLVIAAVAIVGIFAYAVSSPQAGAPVTASSSVTSSYSETESPLLLNTSVSPQCLTLVKTVSSQGYAINTYVSSTSAREGDVVCIIVVLLNMDGRNLTLSSDGGMGVSYTITERSGAVVYQRSCALTPSAVAPGNATTTASPIGAWSCGGFWDTGAPYNGIIPGAGTYDISYQASVPDIVGHGLSEVDWTGTVTLTQ